MTDDKQINKQTKTTSTLFSNFKLLKRVGWLWLKQLWFVFPGRHSASVRLIENRKFYVRKFFMTNYFCSYCYYTPFFEVNVWFYVNLIRHFHWGESCHYCAFCLIYIFHSVFLLLTNEKGGYFTRKIYTEKLTRIWVARSACMSHDEWRHVGFQLMMPVNTQLLPGFSKDG